MQRPVIGITSYLDHTRQPAPYISLKVSYARAVELAGGTPIVLPANSVASIPTLLPILDGIIFSGGIDIAPWFYGQEPQIGIGAYETDRDQWEIELCNRAWEAHVPMLGICRGCQLMNVARGGTLIQDIARSVPNALLHNPSIPHNELSHHIEIEDDSALASIFKTKILHVNSLHHQAVDVSAPDFKVVARSGDEVIEALEPIDPGRFALALQFHPEGLFERYPDFLEPFKALVNAAFRRGCQSC